MSNPQTAPTLLWFRRDLRLSDHPALAAAVAQGGPIVPLYILDDETPGPWAPGGASRWWMHGSLAALAQDLAARGSRLILRRGKAEGVLAELLAETGARALYFTRRYEAAHAAEEQAIHRLCRAQGVECRRFGGALLFEPEALTTKAGDPFRVFTPFYKACLARNGIKAALPAPDNIPAPAAWPRSDGLAHWELRPSAPDWAAGFAGLWQPGSAGAQARLTGFLDRGVTGYGAARDVPAVDGTSALSPHLHFGDISPRQIWQVTRHRAEEAPATAAGGQAFLREVIWREFSYHLLHHWPQMTHAPFNDRFAAFPWREDPAALKAWRRGRTGYPIVDAGMRQLWHSGWMHNRVRMIVASFLTKHLLLPWQEGARWFWDTLVDADLANNSAGWQWVAGSGADAAPYFRVFNPVLQSRKFDAEGVYLRRWLPELAGLSNDAIHAPWEQGLTVAGYPAPMVDHKEARQRALAAYEQVKQG